MTTELGDSFRDFLILAAIVLPGIVIIRLYVWFLDWLMAQKHYCPIGCYDRQVGSIGRCSREQRQGD